MHCLGLLVLVAAAAMARAEDPAQKAARERQERFKTVEVVFERVDLVRPGAATEMIAPGRTKVPVLPATDQRLESENRIVMDGKRFRYESGHPVYNVDRQEYEKMPRVHVTNGEVAKSLDRFGSGHLAGQIEGTPRCIYATDIVIAPLAFFCRGTDPMLCAYPLTRFKPTGEKQRIAGHECAVYVLQDRQQSVRLLLDTEGGYVVRQAVYLRNGAVTMRIDIDHGSVGGISLFPTKWKIDFISPKGLLTESRSIVVKDARFLEAVPASEFGIAFPPGTTYYDQRDNKTYEIDPAGNPAIKIIGGLPDAGTVATWLTPAIWIAGLVCLLSALLYVVLARYRGKGQVS